MWEVFHQQHAVCLLSCYTMIPNDESGIFYEEPYWRSIFWFYSMLAFLMPSNGTAFYLFDPKKDCSPSSLLFVLATELLAIARQYNSSKVKSRSLIKSKRFSYAWMSFCKMLPLQFWLLSNYVKFSWGITLFITIQMLSLSVLALS